MGEVGVGCWRYLLTLCNGSTAIAEEATSDGLSDRHVQATSQPEEGEPRMSRSERKLSRREQFRIHTKEKRPQERRKRRWAEQAKRREMLADMADDERRRYILREREEEEKTVQDTQRHLTEAYETGLPVCINCGFDDQMNDKELRSLAKQIFYSYHAMKSHRIPLQIHLTSFSKSSPLYSRCTRYAFDTWKIHQSDRAYWEVFPSDQLIVLTPDAEEELEDIDKTKTYVIGGLVDRSVSKLDTWREAVAKGLQCRKLPFSRYIDEYTNAVLNVNTVVEVMVKYMASRDWKQALMAATPQRKQAMMGRRGRRRARLREGNGLKASTTTGGDVAVDCGWHSGRSLVADKTSDPFDCEEVLAGVRSLDMF
eukprot:GHVS01048408.1.p1 GENE.GHVS01048408.1~~GHVS01048408.1.p1  ORF type:complete len:368 (-),score=61.43 GHVS01048408.1:243-1346(-)